MLRSTSVVITTTGACELIEVSPVSRPTRSGPYCGDQVGELLIRQRLDRCGVEAFAAGGQRLVHGELADHGLACAGRRADQHPAARLQRPAGVDLELVEGERPGQGELGEQRMAPAIRGAGEPFRRGHVRFVSPTVSRHPTRVTQPEVGAVAGRSVASARGPRPARTQPGHNRVSHRRGRCPACRNRRTIEVAGECIDRRYPRPCDRSEALDGNSTEQHPDATTTQRFGRRHHRVTPR